MKQVIILSGLLGIALVGSSLTWTQDDDASNSVDDVEVYKASPDDLEKITWKGDKSTIEVERKSDERGDYMGVVSTEKKEKKKPKKPKDPDAEEGEEPEGDDGHDHGEDALRDPHAAEGDGEDEGDEEPEPEPEIEIKVTRYHGNKAADEMWEKFAPLVALRELGQRIEMDQEVLGFKEPTATLEVVRRSGPLELTVGGETYGAKDRYLASAGKVFLVDDAVLRPLQYATTRLVERAVQPLAEADIEKVSVRLPDGRSAELIHQNRDDRAKAFWALAATPDDEDASAGTWLAKLLKIRVNAYVGADDVEGELVPVFTWSVAGDGQTWTVEMLEVEGDANSDYYARPEYARSMVKLTRSLAADAIDDLEAIFPE